MSFREGPTHHAKGLMVSSYPAWLPLWAHGRAGHVREPRVLSPLLADAINPGRASDEQAIAGQGGRGHAHVVPGQLVRLQKLKPVASPNHEGYAIFIKAEDPAVASHRCGGEMQSPPQRPEIG